MAKIKSDESVESSKETKTIAKKRRDDHKRKLRSLVKSYSLGLPKKSISAENLLKDNLDNFDERNYHWKWKRLALALLILSASVFFSSVTINSCGFWATYESNLNKIVHGDERWCWRIMESLPIVDKLKERVVGQNDAIALVGASLDLVNRESVVQLAFIGDIGTGKTLISNILMENFKWQENVVSLIFDLNFNIQLTDETATENDVNVISTRLSECGFNLVVIDDVNLESTTIKRIVALERKLHRMAKQKLAKIILVVIFKGSLKKAKNQAEFLKDFVIVEFAPFTEETFLKCIEIHKKIHDRKLKPKDVEELRFINFTNSGCKTVAKKMNLIPHK